VILLLTYSGLVQDISGFEWSEQHYTVLSNSCYSLYYMLVSYTIDKAFFRF